MTRMRLIVTYANLGIVVATRRSGKGSQENEVVQIVGPELRKRKSSVISKDEEEEEEEIEEPPSAKRRRVGKTTPKSTPKKDAEKDLEIRTKNTVCVVEIPAMTPIPVTELSASEPEGEDADAEDEIFIEELEVVEEPEAEVQVSTEKTEAPERTIPEPEQTLAQPHLETTTSPPTSKKTSPVEESQTLDHIPPSRPQSFQHKSSLPALLPDEYLNDTPSSTISFPKPSLPLVKAKKIKFANFVPDRPAPKDVRIGGTTYQVAKKPNLNLAPKSLNKARLTKESWMQGRTGSKLGNGRRPVGKGFFVK